jgi:putative acetyltransferase
MIQLRREREKDRAAIRAVHDAAFGGPDEGRLVDRLRRDGAALLSLPALVDGRIVGHILFSRLAMAVPAVALAPVGVLPGHQRRGIGSSLVRKGLELCRERGIAAVLVLGEPAYYERFGFSVDLAEGLDCPYSGPYLQALELLSGTIRPGTVGYPPAFSA